MSYPFVAGSMTREAQTESRYQAHPFAKEAVAVFQFFPGKGGLEDIGAEILRRFSLYGAERGRSARKWAVSATLFVLERAGWPTVRQTLGRQLWAVNRGFRHKRSGRKLLTSSKKLKAVRFEQLQDLYGYLCEVNLERIAKWTLPIVVIVCKTGCRPIELAGIAAAYHGQTLIVTIPNAKHSNGRGHGKSRTQRFSPEDHAPDEIQLLDQSINAVREFLDDSGDAQLAWARLYGVARKTMLQANRTLWPTAKRHLTLYTLRHQFAADAKASGVSPVELATLMGHITDCTAQTNYANRSKGRAGGALPTADPREKSRVKQNFDQGRQEAIRLKRAKQCAPAVAVAASFGGPTPRM